MHFDRFVGMASEEGAEGGEGSERIGWTGDSKIWSNQMNNAEVAPTENTHNNAINNKSGRLQEKGGGGFGEVGAG